MPRATFVGLTGLPPLLLEPLICKWSSHSEEDGFEHSHLHSVGMVAKRSIHQFDVGLYIGEPLIDLLLGYVSWELYLTST